jgi:acyl-CoA hydrolase
LDVGEHLHPGDSVLVGQGVAEPTGFVAGLVDASARIPGLTAICGYSLDPVWAGPAAHSLRITTYAAHGAMRQVPRSRLDVLPEHLSRFEAHIATGRLPVDVVLLQVGPADADGFHDLGPTVDYGTTAVDRARVVLVEINERMPRTRSPRRLHRSAITAAISVDRPLVELPSRPVGSLERRVAAHVAALIPDGAVIQLGIGPLADAVAEELRGHRRLRVRSGLVGDWLATLAEAGALEDSADGVVAGMALGTEKLYAFIEEARLIEFAPLDEQLRRTETADGAPFFSINSTIEVDLLGQVNAEVVDDRYVGAVGGQGDWFRAAHRADGTAVVALPSTSPGGGSRVRPAGNFSVVTTPKSDVDVVVTEWGAAELRGATMRQRAERLTAVAHPDHRSSLAADRPGWL